MAKRYFGVGIVVPLVIVFGAGIPLASSGEIRYGSDSDTRAVVDAILNALGNDSPERGAGEAIVSFKRDGKEGSEAPYSEQYAYYVKYAFDGQRSRSEMYDYDSEKQTIGNRYVVHVDTGEQYVSYNTGVSQILTLNRSTPVTRFQLGKDFRPTAFSCVHAQPFAETVALHLDHYECEVTNTEDGLVKLTVHADRGDPGWTLDKGTGTYTFDPAKGYAIVEYRDEGLGISAGRRDLPFSTLLKISYQKAGDRWYPKNAVLDRRDEGSGDEKYVRNEHLEVAVVRFDPAAVISDSDFTIEGMHVPRGTRVYDVTTKTWRSFGTDGISEAELRDILKNIQFSDKDIPSASSQNKKPEGTSSGGQPGDGKSVVAQQTSSGRLWLYAALGCLVLVAIVFCACRLRRRNAAS